MDRRQQNDSQRPDEARIAQLAVAFADALTTGDEIAADIAISEAMDAGLSTAEIDERLIAPGMWLVGELWQRGEGPAARCVIGGAGLTAEAESRPEVRHCRGVSDAVDAVDAMVMRAGRN